MSATLGIAASIVGAAETQHGLGEAFSYPPEILISIAAPYLVGSIAPGLLLLFGRRWFARTLFRAPAEGEISVNGETMAIIGFVLVGTFVAIGGLLGVARVVAGIIMLPERFSDSFAAAEMKIGIPVALVRIAIGFTLMRGASRIAKWI